MKWLQDERFFNYLIMVLYALNATRWACAGKVGDCMYWLGALWITATITFLYKH